MILRSQPLKIRLPKGMVSGLSIKCHITPPPHEFLSGLTQNVVCGTEEKKSDGTDDGFALNESTTSRDESDGGDKVFVDFERDGFWEASKTSSREGDSEEQEVSLGMEKLLNDRYVPKQSHAEENAAGGSKKGANSQVLQAKSKKKPGLRSLGLFR